MVKLINLAKYKPLTDMARSKPDSTPKLENTDELTIVVSVGRKGAVAQARDMLNKLEGKAAIVISGAFDASEVKGADVLCAEEHTTPLPGKIYVAPESRCLSLCGNKILLSNIYEKPDPNAHVLLHELEKSGTEGMLMADRSYRAVWFNRKFAQFHRAAFGSNIRRGEMIPECGKGKEAEALRARYDRIFSGEEYTEEINIPGDNGIGCRYILSYRPARNADGICTGAWVTMTDRTSEKSGELAHEKKEKLYRALIENGGEAVAILGPDGKPKYVSESVKNVLGYTRREATQINLFEVLHPDDTAHAQKVLSEAMNAPGKTLPGGVLRMKVKNGTYRYFEASITNMLHDPDIGGIVDNFRDVTDSVSAMAETAFEKRNRDALINNTKDLIWSIDKDYKLLSANRAMKAAMKAMSGSEIQPGDNMLDERFSSEAYLTFWKELYNRSLSGESVEITTAEPETDSDTGSTYDTTLTPIKDGEHIIGVACFAHDISERKRQELLLTKRNEFIETTLDNLPIGIAVHETGTGKMTLMNGRFTEIYGWPQEALTNLDQFFNAVYPDKVYRDEMKTRVMEDMASEDIERMRWNGIKITTAEGKERYVNAQNIPLPRQGLMISTVLDVTREFTAAKALKESSERFELLTKVSFEAVWDFDVRTGMIFWGAGMEANFGHSFENDTSNLEEWADMVHPQEAEAVISSFENALNDETAERWGADYRLLKADDSHADVRDRGYIMRDSGGRVIRVIGAIQDVTAEKEYEKNLLRLNEDLRRHAEDLAISNADLEQFAYVASHDLQEPLRMVTGFLTQIEKKYAPLLDEKGLQYIHFATDGARRMRQIILDLLEYSRVGRAGAGYEETDMNACLEAAKQILAGNIRETDTKISAASLPIITAIPAEMRQMFQNLLANAIKYCKNEISPEIYVGANDLRDHFEFFVKDNGIGIDPAYSEKIFAIFQRLHVSEKYSGTGIGLAICKKIAENHRGTIRVESTEGAGSTFFFTVAKRL